MASAIGQATQEQAIEGGSPVTWLGPEFAERDTG